jgi:AcrR family transcriptional regulator
LSVRGLAGASFSVVIDRSGAPRGSIYHHFPDGKDSLAEEAIALVGAAMLSLLQPRAGDTPEQVLSRFIDAWRTVLVRSDFKAGCAIAAVANERLAHSRLGARAGEVFVAWEQALTKALLAAGLAPERSAAAASLAVASMEGALILCRARRELAPLEAAGAALLSFVAQRG